MTTIDTLKLDTEELSIERYMALTENERANIKSVKIIPPHFSDLDFDDDFGKLKVKYKVPSYKIA